MRRLAALGVALVLVACQGTTATSAPSGQPASAAPGSTVPGQSAGPGTPGPQPSGSGTVDPTTVPLPEPTLGSVEAIVQAMADPALAEQAVVSMLDFLGIGLYEPSGTVIRVGTETTDADFFLFEPEARGLASMLRNHDRPDDSISLRELHAGLAGLGFEGTAEELARAYAESYAAQPSAPVSQLVAALTKVDVEARLPMFAAWLLVLDGFIPPNAAATAVAMGGGGISPVAAGGGSWGTARGRVSRMSGRMSPIIARYVALLTALSQGWSISAHAEANDAHEGHGGLGSPVRFRAFANASARQFTSPITGNLVLPVDYGGSGISGIHISWRPDAAANRHGSLSSSTSAVDATNTAYGTYTPRQEDANVPQDANHEEHEQACAEATVPREELLVRLYGSWVAPFASFVRGDVRGTACLDLGWHEIYAAGITIKWTDVYDGVQDTITFRGSLTDIQPRCDADPPPTGPCSIDGRTMYMGTGTATGSRGGWKACNPGIDVVPDGTATATFTGEVKGGLLLVGAFADFGTALSGVITGVFQVSLDGGKASLLPAPLLGELCPHTSFGEVTVKDLVLPSP